MVSFKNIDIYRKWCKIVELLFIFFVIWNFKVEDYFRKYENKKWVCVFNNDMKFI